MGGVGGRVDGEKGRVCTRAGEHKSPSSFFSTHGAGSQRRSRPADHRCLQSEANANTLDSGVQGLHH